MLVRINQKAYVSRFSRQDPAKGNGVCSCAPLKKGNAKG